MAMHKPLYLLILFGFFLAGCAAGGERPQTLEQKLAVKKLIVGDPVRAIRNYRIDGWSYLDSRHLVVDSGVKDRYLVSLRHDCDELRNAFDIGFKTYTGSLTGPEVQDEGNEKNATRHVGGGARAVCRRKYQYLG
jgi:hypothetical protein